MAIRATGGSDQPQRADPPQRADQPQRADPPFPRGTAAARNLLNADQTAADGDQTAADADQSAADADQAASDLDQQHSNTDQLLSDRDQASADKDHRGGGDAAPQSDYEATSAAREQVSLERRMVNAERQRTADGRDATARSRDELASRRDRNAAERDSLAAELETSNAAIDSSIAQRFRELREQAARDRAEAALDRDRAARDRAEASRERALLEQELLSAHLDDLTGAYRRDMGRLVVSHELDRARRGDGRFVLAFVDLDDLKVINDRDGHAAGDSALQAVVNTMRSALRSYDPIFRYGGDEFVAGMSGTGLEEARRRFEAIQEMLQREAGLSISVGLAALDGDESTDELTARADRALAKRKGVRRHHHDVAAAPDVEVAPT